ncbi:hypothetical protein LCGC14_2391300 [marine sediment metagenome]|uniref:NIPSNAP domain-containing protein n=1 Tax=marine sediment metagenome TaxID=412755 RepID=A0A0F9CK72_9ZZZZ
MDILSIGGFDVLPGKALEFQKWVRENMKALSDATPEGIELIGIYASIFYSADNKMGQSRIIWRFDSYGAQDRFAAAMAAKDTEFARLLEEMGSFNDVRLGAGFSIELLKSVSDLSIWADNPED